MVRFIRFHIVPYVLATLFTLASFLLIQATPLKEGAPFLLFVFAVILSAHFGGFGSGLAAGVLSIVFIAYYFAGAQNNFSLTDFDTILWLGVFAAIVLVINLLTMARERAKARAATQACQQQTVARLGQQAVANRDLSRLFADASKMLCETLDLEFCAILEFLPQDNELVLRAGYGWRPNAVGNVKMKNAPESLAGYTSASAAPVIVQDMRREARFTRPQFLAEHAVVSGLSVVIPNPASPFGILGVYSNKRRQFSDDDVHFLQAIANVLGSVIERVHTDQQVNAHREWLRVTLSSIGDGVIVTDASGRVNFINPIAQQLTGWTFAEAEGKPITEVFNLVDEKTGKPLTNPATRTLQSGKPATLPRHGFLARRDTTRIAIADSIAPMNDQAGKLIGAVLTFRDTTLQRQTEMVIRQNEERFRVALKNSPIVVYSQDRDLRYTWVYNPGGDILNQTAIGKTDEELLPASEATRLTEIKREVITRAVGTREEVLMTVDGQRRTLDLTIEPLRDAEGTVIGITCASFDVTERKREQASIARLAAIVESSHDAIIGKSLDGIILSWNPGAERLFGYQADQVIGLSASLLYPPDRQDEFHNVTVRLKQGQSVEQYDTVRIRKNGEPIDVSVSVSLVRDGIGRVIGASTIARDITERKQQEELARFRAQVGDLLAASFDYKTTLTSIARLVVPRLADWCVVHIRDDDGALNQVALAHVNPAQVERAEELARRYPADPNERAGVANVIRTGKPELIERITDEQLAAAARDIEHLKILIDLELGSAMIVPLTAHDRTFGAITFVRTKSGRHYTSQDLVFAQDLANSAALATDNARLYHDLQRVNDYLEQRVVHRTVELQQANRKLQEEIAERQRTTQQLRLLSAHLQSAREEERARVAREIHDEFGQVLTAVKMDLATLTRNLADPKTMPREVLLDQISTTTGLVDNSVKKMREIIHELRPEILDQLGLKAAIEWQTQEFQTRTGIQCLLTDTSPDIPLDRDRATAVFRILQETLTNIVRHAQATRVLVNLTHQGDQLILQVQDNGRGITESEINNIQSFGILGIRERALLFGGQVDWQGAPGKGTTVTVQIPLAIMSD